MGNIQYSMKDYTELLRSFVNKEITKEEYNRLSEELKEELAYEKRIEKIKFWMNFDSKLNTSSHIPNIDLRGQDYQDYIIPALIRNGAITINRLKKGHYYYGQYRSGNFAKWTGKYFKVWRHKFGSYYLDNVNHFQDDNNYSLFIPIREITKEQFNNREI